MSNTLHSIQLGVGHTAVCIILLHFVEEEEEVEVYSFFLLNSIIGDHLGNIIRRCRVG